MKNIKRIDDNKTFSRIEEMVLEFQNIVPYINLLDNYNHRVIRIEVIVKELWPDFKLNTKRNKEDAKCPSLGLEKIEIKTKNFKNNESESTMFKAKFMFDKQDREARREYILKSDALVFAVFKNEELHWLAWSKDNEVLKEYVKLCKNKQEEFLLKWNEIQKDKSKNGGNDAITISLSEFVDNTIWNFYYDKTIYSDFSLNEIKKIFNIV